MTSATSLLSGTCVYLRPLTDSDVTDEYVSWLNDPEVTRYLDVGGRLSTIATVREYLKRFDGSSTDLIYAIVDKATGKHIGNVTLNRIRWPHATADTGLLIGDKAFWRRGYATEAWYLVLEEAFRGHGLYKVTAGACVANTASIAVLRKLGFQVEGILRGEFFLDGERLDVLRLGLMRNELTRPDAP